nr:hypothetical protein [Natronorubrum halalkaliphilum]
MGGPATNVLAAREYYTFTDPYDRSNTPSSRPTFGLDDGETDGIVLANTLDVDGFLTDEFGGTNFALIHAVLQASRIVPTPRLIVITPGTAICPTTSPNVAGNDQLAPQLGQ